MSRFVLDSDTVTHFEYGHPVVHAHVASHPVTDIALPVIVVQEQMRGWLGRLSRLKTAQQQADWYNRLVSRIMPVWHHFDVLSYTQSAILRFDNLRSLKLKVGHMDLRIAAIALENGCTVETSNKSDFGRVPGLSIVDWTI